MLILGAGGGAGDDEEEETSDRKTSNFGATIAYHTYWTLIYVS